MRLTVTGLGSVILMDAVTANSVRQFIIGEGGDAELYRDAGKG